MPYGYCITENTLPYVFYDMHMKIEKEIANQTKRQSPHQTVTINGDSSVNTPTCKRHGNKMSSDTLSQHITQNTSKTSLNSSWKWDTTTSHSSAPATSICKASPKNPLRNFSGQNI